MIMQGKGLHWRVELYCNNLNNQAAKIMYRNYLRCVETIGIDVTRSFYTSYCSSI
jgi:hypothetical protein